MPPSSSWRSRHVLSLALMLALFLAALPASAQDRIAQLGEKLASGSDFRVRTQAALALGASRDGRAVPHLCKGLADSSRTVRGASASGLARLKKGGRDCLDKRLAVEPSDWVKKALRRAIAKLGGGISIPSGVRFLIAVGTPNDKSELAVAGAVRRTMSTSMGSHANVFVAPAGTSTAAAEKALASAKGVAGFYLLPKVYKPKYAGSELKVKLKVTVFKLPGKILKGSFKKKLAMSGVSGPDPDRAKSLIDMAATKAAEQFIKVAPQFE